jgi:hypothetical protein
MPPNTEKIPDDFVPELEGREKVLAWFVRRGWEVWWRRVRWLRVGVVLSVLAVACYLAVATAAFVFVRQVRQVDTASWWDVALPWRWEHYRVARGEQQIAEAKHFVEEGKLLEALLYLRTGIASSPANRDGRLLLVDLLGAAQRPQVARATLLEGLRWHAGDPVYVKPVLTYLLQQQEDAHVVALAGKYLRTAEPSGDVARLFALAAATAGYFRGNYDQAEDCLRQVPRLAESRDGRLLAIKIERDRGYGELALLRLRQLATELPHDAEVARDLVSLLRARGLADEARRTNLAFQIAHPTLAGPRIELLHAYREAGETARVAREVATLLRDFAADNGALLALADFGANAGDVALVKRIAAQAEGRKLPTAPYAFLAVEAALVAKDYRGALDAIRAYLIDASDWAQRYRALFDSLQALAHYGLGDPTSARSSLESFLEQPNLRADNLLAVANRFADLGAAEQAWQTLARAVAVDPQNQAAMTRLVELDLQLGRMEELATHVRQFVKLRRPSPEILRVVQFKLGSDLWMFSPETPRTLEVVRAALAQVAEGGRR